MVLIPILGETFLQAVSGELTAGVDGGVLAAGFIASFITGCLACKFMLEVVKARQTHLVRPLLRRGGIVSILSYIF